MHFIELKSWFLLKVLGVVVSSLEANVLTHCRQERAGRVRNFIKQNLPEQLEEVG
jgi:hypothetical protein